MISKRTILCWLVLGLYYEGSYSMSYIDRAFQALQDDFEQIHSGSSYQPNQAIIFTNSTSVPSVVEDDQKLTSRTDHNNNYHYFIPELFLPPGNRGGAQNFFPPQNNLGSFRHNAPTRATIQLRNIPERGNNNQGGAADFIPKDNNAIRIIPLDSRGRSLDENAVYGYVQQPNTQAPITEGGRPYMVRHRTVPPHATQISPFGQNGPTGFMDPNFMYNSGVTGSGYSTQSTSVNQQVRPEDEEPGYIFVSPSSTTQMMPVNPEDTDRQSVNKAIEKPQEDESRRPNENEDQDFVVIPLSKPRTRPSPNTSGNDSPIGYIRFPPPPSLQVTNKIKIGELNLNHTNDYLPYENSFKIPGNVFRNPFLSETNDTNEYPKPFYHNFNPWYNNNASISPFVPIYPFKNTSIPGPFNYLPIIPFNKTFNATAFENPFYQPPPNFFNKFSGSEKPGQDVNPNHRPWNRTDFSVFLKPPPGFFDNPLNRSQPDYSDGFVPFSFNSTGGKSEGSEDTYPQPVYPGSKVYEHGQPYNPDEQEQGGSKNYSINYEYEYPQGPPIPSPPLKNTSYSYDEESYHRIPPDAPDFIPPVPEYKPYDFGKGQSRNNWTNSELERETDQEENQRQGSQELEGVYRPQASTITSHSSKDHTDFSLNFERPQCAKEGDTNFCILDPDYPRKVIEKAMLENESMSKLLYKDLSIKDYDSATAIPPTDDLVDNRKQEGVLNPNLETELNRKSIRKNEEEDSTYRCASVVHYAKLTRARNLHGEWKVIVNLDKNMEQVARLEVCTNVNSECIYTGKKVDSKCFQKQDKFKLLCWNSARGLHTDMFYLPVACSCFVGNTL